MAVLKKKCIEALPEGIYIIADDDANKISTTCLKYLTH